MASSSSGVRRLPNAGISASGLTTLGIGDPASQRRRRRACVPTCERSGPSLPPSPSIMWQPTQKRAKTAAAVSMCGWKPGIRLRATADARRRRSRPPRVRARRRRRLAQARGDHLGIGDVPGEPFGAAGRRQPLERIGHPGLGSDTARSSLSATNERPPISRSVHASRRRPRPGGRASRARSGRRRRRVQATTADMTSAALARIAIGTAIDPRQAARGMRRRGPERPSRRRLPTCRGSTSTAGRARGNTTPAGECTSHRSGSAGPSSAGAPCHANAASASTTTRRPRCRARPGTDRSGIGGPSRGRTGPEIPCRRISTRCATTSSTSDGWQEDHVHRVPARQRQRADRRAAAQHAGDDVAGARGVSLEMLIVTTVAQ